MGSHVRAGRVVMDRERNTFTREWSDPFQPRCVVRRERNLERNDSIPPISHPRLVLKEGR